MGRKLGESDLTDLGCVERIIVRSPNWIGDAVLSTPAVRALRTNFPEARVTVLAKPWVSPIFYNNPYVDAILEYESEGRHGGWTGKARLVRALRHEGFDLAILLQNAFEAALLVYLAGVPKRLGYDTDLRGPLLTHRIRVRQESRGCHQLEYYLGGNEGRFFETKW